MSNEEDDIHSGESNIEDEDNLEPRVPLYPDPELIDPNESKYKYGIIYLSYIPEGVTVKILREIMSEFGQLGRIYLEPEKNNKKHRTYTEGWIEFKKKRVAKNVAKTLNGTPLQYGRKRCKINGQIWSIEYLHKFKWTHLIEKLAHNNAVKEQRRKFEMSQAKKEVSFYQKMTEKSKRGRKKNTTTTDQEIPTDRNDVDDNNGDKLNKSAFLDKRQKKSKKQGSEMEVTVDDDLLSSIFRSVS